MKRRLLKPKLTEEEMIRKKREYMRQYMKQRYYEPERRLNEMIEQGQVKTIIKTQEQASLSPPVPEKSKSGHESESFTIFSTDTQLDGLTSPKKKDKDWDLDLT
jgi:3-methyladenine DNA glycosylase/8-oxoguanine DNA glycosylase